jgi:hypothetical protein
MLASHYARQAGIMAPLILLPFVMLNKEDSRESLFYQPYQANIYSYAGEAIIA